MPRRSILFWTIFCLPLAGWCLPAIVEMQTNLGTITIKLNVDKAPITSENFIAYITDDYYNQTLFHRVVKDFVIQGGGYDLATAGRKTTKPAIVNEANNGLSNSKGTISMARTNDPNSATSQFFINLKDNTGLDYSNQSAGYAVFGEVLAGMDVAEAIGNLVTYSELPYTSDGKLVYIEKVYTAEAIDTTKSVTRLKVMGDGKVTSSPKGVNCTAAGTSLCEVSKPSSTGKMLTLRAKPGKNLVFAGWSGDCSGYKPVIKLPLTQNHNCTVTFKPVVSTPAS